MNIIEKILALESTASHVLILKEKAINAQRDYETVCAYFERMYEELMGNDTIKSYNFKTEEFSAVVFAASDSIACIELFKYITENHVGRFRFCQRDIINVTVPIPDATTRVFHFVAK